MIYKNTVSLMGW